MISSLPPPVTECKIQRIEITWLATSLNSENFPSLCLTCFDKSLCSTRDIPHQCATYCVLCPPLMKIRFPSSPLIYPSIVWQDGPFFRLPSPLHRDPQPPLVRNTNRIFYLQFCFIVYFFLWQHLEEGFVRTIFLFFLSVCLSPLRVLHVRIEVQIWHVLWAQC